MDFSQRENYTMNLPISPLSQESEVRSMEPIYRQEINAFALASEALLSRVVLDPPMNADERKVVEFYLGCLKERCKELEAAEANASARCLAQDAAH